MEINVERTEVPRFSRQLSPLHITIDHTNGKWKIFQLFL